MSHIYRPILFSTQMVRALLDGRKTQTRRVVNRLIGRGKIMEFCEAVTAGYRWMFRDQRMSWHEIRHEQLMERCPYGQPGDLLWVRENWAARLDEDHIAPRNLSRPSVFYWADGPGRCCNTGCNGAAGKVRPSIHMPRWASRVTLRIKSVRVERLQDISAEDACAEGVEVFNEDGNLYYSGWMEGQESWFSDPWKWHCNDPVSAFCELWDGINFDKGGWAVNPWVWVVDFEVIPKNVDQVLMEAS